MAIDATSQNSIGLSRYAARGSPRLARAWKACPPSWSRVRTSPSRPTAFMKMNGSRSSSSVVW